MQVFDITALPGPVDGKLAKRLGFQRILNEGNDIEILEFAGEPSKPFLIASGDPNVVYKLIRSNNAVGLLVEGGEIDSRMVAKIKDSGKLIVFDANYIIMGQQDRASRVHRLRKVFRFAHNAKMGTAIISLAQSSHYLLSSAQLMEIAKLITNDDREAKLMLQGLGEAVK